MQKNIGITALEAKKAELAPLINKWIALSTQPPLDEEAAEVRAPAEAQEVVVVTETEGEVESPVEIQPEVSELKKTEMQIDAILATLATKVQVMEFSTLGGFILGQLDVAKQLVEIQPQVSPIRFQEILAEQTNNVVNLSKLYPVLGMSISMVDFEKVANADLARQVMAPGTSERQRGMIFSNIETINRYFYSAHSEFNR